MIGMRICMSRIDIPQTVLALEGLFVLIPNGLHTAGGCGWPMVVSTRIKFGGPIRNFSLSEKNLSAGLVRHIKSGQAYPQNDGNRCGCDFL